MSDEQSPIFLSSNPPNFLSTHQPINPLTFQPVTNHQSLSIALNFLLSTFNKNRYAVPSALRTRNVEGYPFHRVSPYAVLCRAFSTLSSKCRGVLSYIGFHPMLVERSDILPILPAFREDSEPIHQ